MGTLRTDFTYLLSSLLFLKELIEAGKVTPVVDRIYSLSDPSEAIRYLKERQARGKVVLTI